MEIKIGCDLVNLERFKKSVDSGGPKFLDKLFSSHELTSASSKQKWAGIFAAKEAVIKALKLKAGDWKKIEVVKDKNGKPKIELLESGKKIESQDVSISHDGEYVVAVVVFLIQS